jgi:hypothetical protein
MREQERWRKQYQRFFAPAQSLAARDRLNSIGAYDRRHFGKRVWPFHTARAITFS